MHVLVTGGNGFIGSRLTEHFRRTVAFRVTISSRKPSFDGDDFFLVRALTTGFNWTSVLKQADAVVHTAAIAHMGKDLNSDEAREIKIANIDHVLELAKQTAELRIKKFIFLSSIGVHGTFSSNTINAMSKFAPENYYAETKLEAEMGLQKIFSGTETQLTIIRPPLVYGPNAPGNFGRLLKMVRTGLPLPFSSINNRRSFIAVDNLIDFIVACIQSSNQNHQTFTVSDNFDVSTSEFVNLMHEALNMYPRQFPVNPKILKFLASAIGRKEQMDQILGSLTVDCEEAMKKLSWRPPLSPNEGMKKAVGLRQS